MRWVGRTVSFCWSSPGTASSRIRMRDPSRPSCWPAARRGIEARFIAWWPSAIVIGLRLAAWIRVATRLPWGRLRARPQPVAHAIVVEYVDVWAVRSDGGQRLHRRPLVGEQPTIGLVLTAVARSSLWRSSLAPTGSSRAAARQNPNEVLEAQTGEEATLSSNLIAAGRDMSVRSSRCWPGHRYGVCRQRASSTACGQPACTGRPALRRPGSRQVESHRVGRWRARRIWCKSGRSRRREGRRRGSDLRPLPGRAECAKGSNLWQPGLPVQTTMQISGFLAGSDAFASRFDRRDQPDRTVTELEGRVCLRAPSASAERRARAPRGSSIGTVL